MISKQVDSAQDDASFLPLEQEQTMRMPTYIWMHRHWEHKLVILAVEVVELVHPQLLYIPRVDPSMTVGSLLDEHHRR